MVLVFSLDRTSSVAPNPIHDSGNVDNTPQLEFPYRNITCNYGSCPARARTAMDNNRT